MHVEMGSTPTCAGINTVPQVPAASELTHGPSWLLGVSASFACLQGVVKRRIRQIEISTPFLEFLSELKSRFSLMPQGDDGVDTHRSAGGDCCCRKGDEHRAEGGQ